MVVFFIVVICGKVCIVRVKVFCVLIVCWCVSSMMGCLNFFFFGLMNYCLGVVKLFGLGLFLMEVVI